MEKLSLWRHGVGGSWDVSELGGKVLYGSTWVCRVGLWFIGTTAYAFGMLQDGCC